MAARSTTPALPSPLLQLRKELGLSRERMARLLDVTAKTVERWEERAALPSRPAARERLSKLQEIVHLGLIVYGADGLPLFLSTPLREFDGHNGLRLIEIGQTDRVFAAVAADYEGLGF